MMNLLGGGETRDSETSRLIASLLDSIQELESKLDFDLLANYTNPTTYPTNSATCHTEPLGEVSTNTESNPAILSDSEKSKNKLDFSPFSKAQNDNLKALLDSIPIPPKHGWERVKVNQVAFYPQDRIEINLLTPHNYVGVDNLLQDKKGKRDAEFILEGIGTTNAYKKNDILIGNIRPYLKKIWLADIDGGTNGDVVVLRVRDSKVLSYKMLFYVMSDNNFFKYEMDNAKGLKMPRGDKTAILNYKIPLPPLEAQEKIISAIEKLESKIHLLDSSLSHLDSKKSEILQHFLQN